MQVTDRDDALGRRRGGRADWREHQDRNGERQQAKDSRGHVPSRPNPSHSALPLAIHGGSPPSVEG
jgi:hypothetical protein